MLPDSEEWTIIEELIAVLKPFHRATTAMSASSYPILSMLSPLLYKLHDRVLQVKEDDTPSGKALKEAILTDLRRRYSSLNQQEMLHAAAFLDPRFKDLDLFVPEKERKDIQESVKLEILDLAVADGNETWKSRQSQYPLLSQLVRKYWSLPATSVRSEEAFSTAGNVLTKKRNRLLPENVDRLVFLHNNM